MNLSDLAKHANGVTGAKDSGKNILIVAKDENSLESVKLKYRELFGDGRKWPDPRRPMPSRFLESPGNPVRYSFEFGRKGSISLASATSGAEPIFHNRDGDLLRKYDIVGLVGEVRGDITELAQGHGFRVAPVENEFDQPAPPKPGPVKAPALPPNQPTSAQALLAENENLKARLAALEKKVEKSSKKSKTEEAN